jgi:hypothetical protein
MKKLWIVVVLLLCATAVTAQVTHWANQATVEWDVVTTLSDGSPVPAGDTIAYRVWTRLDGVETMVAEVSSTSYTFTFDVEGIYTVGVQTIRYPENGDPEVTSEINWSDVNGVMTPDPFYLGFYLPAAAPEGLRVQ